MSGEGENGEHDDFVIPSPDEKDIVTDEKADKEAATFALGKNLEKKQTDNKLRALTRSDDLEQHLHKLLVCFLYLAFVLIAGCVVVLFMHYVTPFRWLSAEEIQNLKDFIFSGGVGAGIATLARNKLGFSDHNNNYY